MRCQLLSPRSCTGTAVRVGVVADTDPHMAFGKGARGHRVPPLCSITPAWHAVHPFLGSVPPRACGPLPCRECRSPAAQYTVISVAMGRVSLPPSPVECVSTASCLPDPYLSLCWAWFRAAVTRPLTGVADTISSAGGGGAGVCLSADGGLGTGLCCIDLCPGPGMSRLPAQSVFECPGSPE